MAVRILPWVCALALVVLTVATGQGYSLMAIGLATQASLFVISWLLPSRPHLFNFPEKERLLRLPASYQAPVISLMRTTLDVTGALLLAVLNALQYLEWREAMGRPVGLGASFIHIGPIFLGPIILIFVSQLSTATEEAEKRWKAAGQPGR